jgi:hypothetical protein
MMIIFECTIDNEISMTIKSTAFSTCLKLNKILFDCELIFAAKGNYQMFAFSKQML